MKVEVLIIGGHKIVRRERRDGGEVRGNEEREKRERESIERIEIERKRERERGK